MKIAIASGKGGTGKTLFSTNLFQALYQHKHQVTLIDCDAEEPNDMLFFNGFLDRTISVTQKTPVIDTKNCIYCGKCAEWCSYNAIFFLKDHKIIKVLDDLCHGCGACSVACNHSAITEKDMDLGEVHCFSISPNAKVVEARLKIGVYTPVLVLKAAIKTGQNPEIVLMDAPPGTSCPFIQTAWNADYVILVTEPSPFGLSDLRQSVDTLKTLNKKYGVVINRAGLGDNSVYEYLTSENIELLLEIPFDKNIASLYSTGQIVSKTDSEFAQKLYNVFLHIRKQFE